MEDQPLPENPTLNNCDREPIHIPGSIQPYGMLVVLDAQNRIARVSDNASAHTGRSIEDLVGQPLPCLIEDHKTTLNGNRYDVTERGNILEFEPDTSENPEPIYSLVGKAVKEFQNCPGIRDLAEVVARRVRELCGFDRVMVYRFLADDTGTVIAEEKRDDLESYSGHHFPASDIPKQARALYVRNWTRLVADVDYRPSPIVPPAAEPLDMSDCALRSVSPIHVQYLKNMGVGASMSISLVKDGRLWGLVACHHMSPWYGSKQLREACELLGQVVSLQITSIESQQAERFFRHSRETLRILTEAMIGPESTVQGLSTKGVELLDLLNATGAAVVEAGACHLIGATPSTEEILRLVRWIGDKCSRKPLAVNSLATVFPEAERYASFSSGLLAICHSRDTANYILWFRPEQIETVTWAGNPDKPMEETPQGNMLRPRTSFASWRETVRLKARPWTETEVAVAADLRIAIVEAELTSLNSELERRVNERTSALQKAVDELNGFTYSVSHDLRTPLRGMIGNSRIVLEEYGDGVSRAIRERLLAIEANALKMANLVDDLLRFARLGRQNMSVQETDLTKLALRCAERLESHGWPCEGMAIEVEEGLRAVVDPSLIEMVFTILIENGCKYRLPDQRPTIEIGRTGASENPTFFVKNAGIGFDEVYKDKLFMPFERLHLDAEYPGTGIGLANAKRIIERHGGKIWAEGRQGEGATFYFTL